MSYAQSAASSLCNSPPSFGHSACYHSFWLSLARYPLSMCTSYLFYMFPNSRHVCLEPMYKSHDRLDVCSCKPWNIATPGQTVHWMVLQGQHTSQRAGFACICACWLCGTGCSSPRLVYAAASTENQCELHDCTCSTGNTCQSHCNLDLMTALTSSTSLSVML